MNPRWIWTRIDELLLDCEWDRADLEECAVDWFGRPFLGLTFDEGRQILRSMTGLAGFKAWKRKRQENGNG